MEKAVAEVAAAQGRGGKSLDFLVAAARLCSCTKTRDGELIDECSDGMGDRRVAAVHVVRTRRGGLCSEWQHGVESTIVGN